MDAMSKALSSQAITNETPEESGWTMYFEDFLANNREQISSPSGTDYGHGSSSMVSDAASSAGKKLGGNDHVSVLSLEKRCQKLSFKKRKTKGAVVDDALEDTASSPVTSPKVGSLDEFSFIFLYNFSFCINLIRYRHIRPLWVILFLGEFFLFWHRFLI